jgi:serine/threonine-protein kinase ATR
MQIQPPKLRIELHEFVPPVQAALSPSSLLSESASKDFFIRNIPRMRAISTNVSVMSSKAKPKRLRAYAVPGTYRIPKGEKSTSSRDDIGEIHFLVKQEAKGDLRKDARVQDLNNVINRLMSSSSGDIGSRQQRRLHLRTFAVSCLSEDVGVLEWVPNTDSLRNIVTKAYNPQAHTASPRRRGQNLNFDASLKQLYEKCQNIYFKTGDLSRAASLFNNEVLRKHPPLLYWWFVQNFHDPHAWYEARTRFTLSAAIWSAVGHVIGLGDRHSENILLDKASGDCVHVDFDW